MRRACYVLLIGLACGDAPAPAAGSSETAAVSVDQTAADQDPLLAEARAALQGGKLPPELEQRILESEDPAHARARRLLAMMKRQRTAAVDEDGTPIVTPAEDEAQPVTPSPSVDETAAQGTGSAEAPTPERESEAEGASAPELTVLTRLELSPKGKGAVLTMRAASELQVGIAQQSRTTRLVVESAGALPAFLQARPSIDGVRVVDVRRGQDTVQIAVEVDEGWKVGRPQGFSGGARLRLTAP